MDSDKPIASPFVVFREEFDDWAILFDTDTGKSFGLNPVSVEIWKCLDGKHNIQDIIMEISEKCEDVPCNAGDLIRDFIQDLVEKGLAGHKI